MAMFAPRISCVSDNRLFCSTVGAPSVNTFTCITAWLDIGVRLPDYKRSEPAQGGTWRAGLDRADKHRAAKGLHECSPATLRAPLAIHSCGARERPGRSKPDPRDSRESSLTRGSQERRLAACLVPHSMTAWME